jgi:phospholipid/cholesterol/gamma-HCH transport system permease protein
MSFDPQRFNEFFQRLGYAAGSAIEFLGGVGTLAIRTVARAFRRPFPFQATMYQVQELGLKSLTIAVITALAVGMVMALQFAFGLSRFGAKGFVGPVVAISLVRELGPVLTALMVGGRIASGMAAELGSMKVTEQVDAILALGADPICKLVVPRVIATVLILPLLVVMADVLGILGGLLISLVELDVTATYYMNSVLSAVKMTDFASGVSKSVFFAFFIAIIACYQGLTTAGGTEGVGQSTTRSVVLASTLVLISDFFLTKLFLVIA